MGRLLKHPVLLIIAGVVLVGACLTAWIAPPYARQFNCLMSMEYVTPLSMSLYSSEHPENKYPAMSSTAGNLFLDYDTIYPKWVSDEGQPVFCSGASKDYKNMPLEEQFDRPTYVYLGYALLNEDELLAFLESYPAFIEEGVNFDEDLPAPEGRGSFGGDQFLRLTNTLYEERGEIVHRIPLLIEIPEYSDNGFQFRHPGNTGSIKFFYGPLRTIGLDEQSPVTQAVIEKIGSIKAMYR